jgi:Glycosyltransferase sugar-binding region containing DXD motif
MSLSICLITADPPSRIAAILEPLRPYADEVLIAADSRVDDETLAGYHALADRLFKIEFRMVERHLAWLFAQCSGDWILRLDGDEVPSRAFVRRLPDMLASRHVQQFWIAVAWLFPDADSVLACMPWSEGFANRLVRNDGTLRIRGQLHLPAEPVAPREYVEEPFYHLELLIADEEERREKAVRYEVLRPRLLAPGGGRINEAFYLPELRDSLELRPVPSEDRDSIARSLTESPVPEPETPSENVRFVSLEEMDRTWEGRTVDAAAYRARIEPFASTSSLMPSEPAPVFFRVTNEGTERWPCRLDEDPPIRLSYRWLHTDGSIHTAEGPRSPLSRAVGPGESILTPLHVDAPADTGDYVLEVDVVHEHVRWFGCSLRVPVRVGHPQGLAPTGVRLRETAPVSFRRWRRVRIPRVIHRIWLGDEPMPAEHERFGETFARHHPGWEMRLWSDEDLAALEITEVEHRRCRTPSELSNLMRYEVLRRFGGVYVDTDFECRRALTPLLRGIDAFAALELPGCVGTAILGSVAGHPAFARAAQQARRTLGAGAHSADANGPYFMSLILEQEANVAIFGAHLFYPYWCDEPERRNETFPDAYAVHHWAQSWHAEEAGR